MRIDIQRWQEINVELKQKRQDIEIQLDNPSTSTLTPQEVDNLNLQRVRTQRQINLHSQDLKERMDSAYDSDFNSFPTLRVGMHTEAE